MNTPIDRIEFLANAFNVTQTDVNTKKELKEMYSLPIINEKANPNYWVDVQFIVGNDKEELLAILCTNTTTHNQQTAGDIHIHTKNTHKVLVGFEVFTEVIAADPTEKKIYVQWMLNMFVSMLKNNLIEEAKRFVKEDLPQTRVNLEVFEANKRKKKFINLCKASFSLKRVDNPILDPSDINQYKSLSELFDAVDPFIEKNSSEMERVLQRFVDIGQAEIPVRDRNYILYVPLTREASEVFGPFTQWCTATKGNSMFSNYINQKRSDNKNSRLYIIIPKEFFDGDNAHDDLTQIHFESNQTMNRQDKSVDITKTILVKSKGISNYFYNELLPLAKRQVQLTGFNNNNYLDKLIDYGFDESIFEVVDESAPTLTFMSKNITKMPDMSRFQNMEGLVICQAGLKNIHPTVGSLTKLTTLCISDNEITELPSEIGNLKNLRFVNLVNNKITNFPSSMTKLDPLNGGSLMRLAITKKDIGEDNFLKLKKMLPSVILD